MMKRRYLSLLVVVGLAGCGTSSPPKAAKPVSSTTSTSSNEAAELRKAAKEGEEAGERWKREEAEGKHPFARQEAILRSLERYKEQHAREAEQRKEQKLADETKRQGEAEEHDRQLLENHVPVGKTAAEVEKLLGEPAQTQEFGGEKLWYYDVPGPRRGEEYWQLVFSGSTVASENKTAT